jgi:hypothetical protein
VEKVSDRRRAQQKILCPLHFLYKSSAWEIIKHKGVNVLKLLCYLYIFVCSVATSPYGQDSVSSTDTYYVCAPEDIAFLAYFFMYK